MIKEGIEEKLNKLNKKDTDLIKEMVSAGVQFGHSKSRKNPKMNPYIYSTRGGINIIDLTASLEKMKEVLEVIKEAKKAGKTILFVGDYPQARKITEKIAKECKMPYVTERWIGGTLTNFKTIHKRIKYLRELEQNKESGELAKYTKKEQLIFSEEIIKLNKNLGGIKDLNKVPDMIFVLSIKKNSTPIKEANKIKIPLIGLADTDSDPSLVTHFIPANDEAISSLTFILEQVKEVVLKVKKSRPLSGSRSKSGPKNKNDKS